MQQLMFEGPGRVDWAEVDEPTVDGPDVAIVRPIAVATLVRVAGRRWRVETCQPWRTHIWGLAA